MGDARDREAGLRIAFELFEAAETIMRQNLRRADPAATDDEVERKLIEWLRDRPGAPDGDAVGVRRVPAETE